MNFIKWLGLVLTKEAKDIYEAGHEYAVHTMRMLYVAIGIPALLLVLGVIIGAVGESAGSSALVGAAHWLTSISGFTAALLLTLFWVRAVVFAHLVVIATKGVGWVWDKIPEVELESAQDFLRWLRSVTLWISAVALYAQLVPVWRNITLSLVVATCVLIFSAMFSARWFEGAWARRGLSVIVLAVFTVSTVALVAPGYASSVRTALERSYGRVDRANERANRLAEVDRDVDTARTELDADLLRRFTARQHEIRRRAVELCEGRICSDQERREYADLGERIAHLRDGSYWEYYGTPGTERRDERPAPTPPPAQQRGRTGGASSLPPPPPGPPPGGSRTTTRPPAGRDHGSRLSTAELDHVFQELEKYPDL